MVDRVNQIPFSQLRTSSIGPIDDYESGMEASASSMAEEEEPDRIEDVLEEDEKEVLPKKPFANNYMILDHKKPKGHSHRRMSSGNSSTDNNATTPNSSKRHHVLPLQKNSTVIPSRLSRKEDLPTPSSGYDGDTEGPLVEDNV